MPCSCGFTTNQDNTCNGNHKIVKAVKDKIISNVEKLIDTHESQEQSAFLENVIKIIKESK